MNQLSTEINELLNKKSTSDFLEIARQFVTLIENDELNQETFYKESHRVLAKLYQKGLELETVDLKFSEPDSEFEEIDNEKLIKINQSLISNLGKECFYWEVFDPTYDNKKEPTQGWLVDDFADIYSDLKEELHKIDNIKTDESIEDALWSLKFGFNHHWGNHCIDAMRGLHYSWYDGKIAM